MGPGRFAWLYAKIVLESDLELNVYIFPKTELICDKMTTRLSEDQRVKMITLIRVANPVEGGEQAQTARVLQLNRFTDTTLTRELFTVLQRKEVRTEVLKPEYSLLWTLRDETVIDGQTVRQLAGKTK